MKNLSTTIDNKIQFSNNIVAGIKVDTVPEPQKICRLDYANSIFNYTIMAVTEDRTEFCYGKDFFDGKGLTVVGYGKLITRKNTKNYGKYIDCNMTFSGKLYYNKYNNIILIN